VLHGLFHVLQRGQGGDHEERQLGPHRSHLLQEVQARHARHLPVADDEVDAVLEVLEHLQRGAAVVGGDDVADAHVLEHHLDITARALLVLGDQHPELRQVGELDPGAADARGQLGKAGGGFLGGLGFAIGPVGGQALQVLAHEVLVPDVAPDELARLGHAVAAREGAIAGQVGHGQHGVDRRPARFAQGRQDGRRLEQVMLGGVQALGQRFALGRREGGVEDQGLKLGQGAQARLRAVDGVVDAADEGAAFHQHQDVIVDGLGGAGHRHRVLQVEQVAQLVEDAAAAQDLLELLRRHHEADPAVQDVVGAPATDEAPRLLEPLDQVRRRHEVGEQGLLPQEVAADRRDQALVAFQFVLQGLGQARAGRRQGRGQQKPLDPAQRRRQQDALARGVEEEVEQRVQQVAQVVGVVGEAAHDAGGGQVFAQEGVGPLQGQPFPVGGGGLGPVEQQGDLRGATLAAGQGLGDGRVQGEGRRRPVGPCLGQEAVGRRRIAARRNGHRRRLLQALAHPRGGVLGQGLEVLLAGRHRQIVGLGLHSGRAVADGAPDGVAVERLLQARGVEQFQRSCLGVAQEGRQEAGHGGAGRGVPQVVGHAAQRRQVRRRGLGGRVGHGVGTGVRSRSEARTSNNRAACTGLGSRARCGPSARLCQESSAE